MPQALKARKIIVSALLAIVLLSTSVAANAASLSAVRSVPGNVVCLTIDDGYSKEAIKKDLDLLRAKKVTCTFFVIGNRLAAYPDLWRQAVKDGHEICYHSMNHTAMGSWSDGKILQDLKAWNSTAKRVLGSDYTIPKLARLPGGSGHGNARILKLFNSLGYKLVGWNVDTYTGAMKAGKPIPGYVLSKTASGSIILTHFNMSDANAMPQYIDALKRKFTLMKVSTAVYPPLFRKPPKSSQTLPASTPPPVIFWGR
mgnify:CR=1 FL=1